MTNQPKARKKLETKSEKRNLSSVKYLIFIQK